MNSHDGQVPLGVLSHYQIISSLGRGGMGLVYLARDTRLEREVAIKCLRSELFEDHYIARFKREALLLAKLNHPNIVQIYDFIETPEQLALVMELVDGENLQIHLREHIVPLSQRIRWLVQISEGLAVAHDAGIIHRDLKPENILINKLNQAKISDLGIAKSQDFSVTLTDHVTGSYCSMSPEQAVGGPIDFRSDLFSLGIVAYQLLCGAHPFGDTTNKLKIMQSIIAHPPTPPNRHNPGLALEIIELLGQLLAKNPGSRPKNAHWVAAQFEQLSRLVDSNFNDSNDTEALSSSVSVVKPRINSSTQDTSIHTTFDPHFVEPNNAASTSYSQLIKTYLGENKLSGFIALFIFSAVIVWKLVPSEFFNADDLGFSIETPEDSVTQKKRASLKPFSKAQALNNGLHALKLYDRPGSLEDAEKSFNEILERSPNNAAAVSGLSLVYSYRNLGDSEDPIWIQRADAAAQQALQLNDQLALAHVAMGRVLNAKSEYDQALAAFAKAQILEPNNIFAWRGKVSTLRSAHRYDEAIELAQQGLEQFPSERFFSDELGTTYIDQGDYIKAEEAFRLSIKLQPDAVYAYASLYIALERQNRTDEAMQVLQQGLQIRSSAWLHGNLGNALFIRGDYLGAAAAFEVAVSPNKGNPGSYLAWANLADTLLWIPGREAEAQKAYRKALDILEPQLQRREGDVTVISRMALYLARLNDRAQAEPMLYRVMVLAPKNANVHFRVGLAYELLDEHDSALAALTKAVELGFPKKLIEAEPDLLNLRRTSGAF